MSGVVIQRRVKGRGVPAPATLRRFAQAGLEGFSREPAGELTLRIVGNAESRALNKRYRAKDKPTNVLSFPSTVPTVAEAAIGDLVLCAPVIAREAREQQKDLRAHWAHMIVHGCLHLRGYDHERVREAGRMEARERKILKELGFSDPYR